MRFELIIDIQTRADLTSWERGEEILNQVFSDSKLTPEKVATFAEVTSKNGKSVNCISECETLWASKGEMRIGSKLRNFTEDFYWRRNRVVKSQGAVSFASVNMQGKSIPGRIHLQSQFRTEVDWQSLFKNWCRTSQGNAGILHPLVLLDGPREKAHRDVRDNTFEEAVQQNAWSRFLNGELFSEFRAGELNTSVSGLTNLGWATWFGGDLAKEVNVTSLGEAGFYVESIGDGFLVQLTDYIEDVVTDFEMFSNRRSKLKSLFRDDLFLISSEP